MTTYSVRTRWIGPRRIRETSAYGAGGRCSSAPIAHTMRASADVRDDCGCFRGGRRAGCGGGSATTTATLNFRADLRFESVPGVCPPGTPDSVVCHARTGKGIVAGLGRVTQTYVFMADPNAPSCASGTAKVLAYSVRWSVAGKGELDLAVAEKPECVPLIGVPSASPQAFTVTGGRERASERTGAAP